MPSGAGDSAWPALPYDEWRESKATLHMFTQVLGKLRLACSPAEPEWQHVALYVTTSGLTTGPVPAGDRSFEATLDLLHHQFNVTTTDGAAATFGLPGRSVAQFYEDVLEALGHVGVTVTINPKPQEVPDPVPFPDDDRSEYDAVRVSRFHGALTSVERALQRFRAPFRGRHSRVQFFWGTFDLNYVRFSGRPATPTPGAGVISRPAMDAEQYYCGFWPGDERKAEPAFFAYTFPQPEGLDRAEVKPGSWDPSMGEFILPYEAVRGSPDPERSAMTFFERSYEAAAAIGDWPDVGPSA
jgi:hypothetical protein